MKTYSWSNIFDEAKSLLKENKLKEAETCYLSAIEYCSEDPEEMFHLYLELAIAFEVLFKDLEKAELYQEKVVENLKEFKGWGNTEIEGSIRTLADIKNKLGKAEEVKELLKEAETYKKRN